MLVPRLKRHSFFTAAAGILLLMLMKIDLPAQQVEYAFKQINIKDGLSQSSVNCQILDREGFLWFGTANGLNRYDGYSFRIFSNDPTDSNSISDNGILTMFQDKRGDIWIGTSEGILNKFSPATGIFTRYRFTDTIKVNSNLDERYYDFPLPLSRNNDNSITAIESYGERYLWIGTWGKGLILFDKESGAVKRVSQAGGGNGGIKTNRIKSLIASADGSLWVGTIGKGLYKLNYKNDSEAVLHFPFMLKKMSPAGKDWVMSLCLDNSGNLWVGTYGGGLLRLDRDRQNLKPAPSLFRHYYHITADHNSLSNDFITSIIQNSEGFLWCGTFGGGLNRLNPSTGMFNNFRNEPLNSNSLSKDDILSLLEDKSGNLWIGTHLGKGLNKLEKSAIKFGQVNKSVTPGTGLNDDIVWSLFLETKNILWIGTYSGGLNRYDRAKNKFTYFVKKNTDPYSISDNHIRAIVKDDFGNLWLGTYSGGLNRFNEKTGRFYSYKNIPDDSTSIGSNQVQSILIDKSGTFWVGTFGGGLNSFNWQPGQQAIEFHRYINDPSNPFSISDDRVYTVFEDRDGIFWVGTFGGGLNRFDKNSGQFISYKNIPGDETSISDNRIMTIFEDENGTLWVGTYGGGLHKFDKNTEKFTRYNDRNRINSSVAYGILEDYSKNLWISTDNGLFKFNRLTENFTQYDLHDGLQSLEFSGGAYAQANDGEMFFGGVNGFNYFYPDSIHDNGFIPPVVLSSIRVLNKPLIGERDTLVLNYNQNFFSFEFASLDYTNPSDNSYAYMLTGIDNDWHYVDARRRIVNYTDLRPGNYTFRVKGSNNDGVWNDEGKSLYLVILPPFWQRWWFILAAIALVGSIIYYISTLRYRNLLAIEKLKGKLAADLHDIVGAGLTEISILSELASHQADNNPGTSPEILNNISDKARSLIDNMSDIVWMVNPQRDSLYHLILRLKDYYSDFLGNMGISFRTINLEKFEHIKLPMEYKRNLFLIFKEGINNSIKHSQCKKISLEANLNRDILELTLKDDGIGLPGHLSDYGNGIKNMSSRAESIGGKLSVVSDAGRGTDIKFTGRISGFNKIKLLMSK